MAVSAPVIQGFTTDWIQAISNKKFRKSYKPNLTSNYVENFNKILEEVLKEIADNFVGINKVQTKPIITFKNRHLVAIIASNPVLNSLFEPNPNFQAYAQSIPGAYQDQVRTYTEIHSTSKKRTIRKRKNTPRRKVQSHREENLLLKSMNKSRRKSVQFDDDDDYLDQLQQLPSSDTTR